MAWTLCASCFLWSATALAQAGHIDGAVRVDVHLNVGLGGGLGPGMRLDVPLARDGLIRSARDELALTLGVDTVFHTHRHAYYDGYHHHPRHAHDYDGDGRLSLLFPLAMQWNFMLPHHWTLFPELGVAFVHHYDRLDVLLDLGFGARWHFGGGQAALLLRVTRPGGFQVGIAW